MLFLSVLVMAIYTLVEATRDPDIARMVAGELRLVSLASGLNPQH